MYILKHFLHTDDYTKHNPGMCFVKFNNNKIHKELSPKSTPYSYLLVQLHRI